MRRGSRALAMGSSTRSSSGEDWSYEGRRRTVLAARDLGKQPEARARQRKRAGFVLRDEGDSYVSGHTRTYADLVRLAFLMTSRYVLGEANRIVCIIHSSYNKTPHIHCMALPFEFGPEQTRSALKLSATCGGEQNQTIMSLRTRSTGSLTA